MKNIFLPAVLGLFVLSASAFAVESTGELVQDQANDTKRAVVKEVHHAEEAACMDSDTKCLMRKAEHRTEEAGDSVVDKASELVNDAD